MSVVFAPVFAIMSAIIAIVTAEAVGISGEAGMLVGAVGLVAGFLGHWYSPIPSHNGGFGMPPARKQKWGFTREPATDHADTEIDEAEVFAWRPKLSPIYWASNQPQEENNEE